MAQYHETNVLNTLSRVAGGSGRTGCICRIIVDMPHCRYPAEGDLSHPIERQRIDAVSIEEKKITHAEASIHLLNAGGRLPKCRPVNSLVYAKVTIHDKDFRSELVDSLCENPWKLGQ